MNAILVVLILALVSTVLAMVLGVLGMGGGGSTSRRFGETLMWARVVFQSLTVLFLILAIILS